MSIATDITGVSGNGANQLLDLLSLVSNPAVYEAKIKALQATIAEHKKIVDAVGPASEVLKLLDQAKADREKAELILSQANVEAASIKLNAEEQKIAVLAMAKKEAADAADAAKLAVAVAVAREKEAAALKKSAEQAKADAQTATVAAKAAEDASKAAKEQADKAKAAAEAERAALVAKHKAFVEGL